MLVRFPLYPWLLHVLGRLDLGISSVQFCHFKPFCLQWEQDALTAFSSPRGINVYLIPNTSQAWVVEESFHILAAQPAMGLCVSCIEGMESTHWVGIPLMERAV